MANIEHLSYSSISSYLLCGEYWRRRYVAHEPAPVASSLVLGSAFHKTVEAYLHGDQDIESAFEHSWTQQLKCEQEIAWKNGLPDPDHDTGLRMLKAEPVRKLLAEIRKNYDLERGAIERRVELRVPDVPVPIIGYIDIITKDGIPGDFKTTNRMWSNEKAGDELQPIYYLAALNQEGIQVPNLTFRHYVFSKGQSPAAKVFETQHKLTEIFGLFELIKAAWRGIENDVYLLQPNTWKCSPQYCEYWSGCWGKWQ